MSPLKKNSVSGRSKMTHRLIQDQQEIQPHPLTDGLLFLHELRKGKESLSSNFYFGDILQQYAFSPGEDLKKSSSIFRSDKDQSN